MNKIGISDNLMEEYGQVTMHLEMVKSSNRLFRSFLGAY